MINVTVTGDDGAGGTEISYVIANALLRIGLSVELNLLDGKCLQDVAIDALERLVVIKENEIVSVTERKTAYYKNGSGTKPHLSLVVNRV